MEQDALDYHLDEAKRHLDCAVQRTRKLLVSEEAERVLADKWSRLLTHLFGQSWT